MQQAVRTAAEEMLSKTVKTFTFQEIVKFGNHPYKNLPELLAQYPNKGVGFKVWRKTWPQNKFIIIKEAEFKVTHPLSPPEPEARENLRY